MAQIKIKTTEKISYSQWIAQAVERYLTDNQHLI